MKLVIAILKDDDTEAVVQALTAQDFRTTRVASTGGFFHKGSSTLLVGVDDKQVDAAIGVMHKNTTAAEKGEKRATVFVVPVERFEQL
jgi:uncharacterized protein YaaQ